MSQALTLDESATVFTNIRAGAQHILDLIAEYERFLAESLRSAALLDQINRRLAH